MQISPLKESELEQYTKLNDEYGSIFTSLEWLKLFKDNITIYGIYKNDGQLIGGFYLAIHKIKGIKMLWQAPYASHLGPFFKIEQKKYVKKLDFEKELIETFARFIDELNYAGLSFRISNKIIDTQPFTWRKFTVIPQYTYIVDLDTDEDMMWENMASENRNDIRKGEKDELEVKQVTDFKLTKELIYKTFDRQNMEVDNKDLEKILFEFANDDNSYSFICYKNGTPISTSFCIYDNQTAYYILGGYDYENKHHSAGTMVIWESIKHAKATGLKYFDFEGSMKPEIEKYFRKFGGKLTTIYRINKINRSLDIISKILKKEIL